MTNPNDPGEPASHNPGAITRLLRAWGHGGEAERELFDVLEPELRRLAWATLHKAPDLARRIEPSELVNETYIRLKRYLDTREDVSFENRRPFFRMVLTVMRHVLLDLAKRGGQSKPETTLMLPLSAVEIPQRSTSAVDAFAFYQALDRLRRMNERQAEAIELHYIVGWTLDECATMMELSTATLKRQLAAARQWFELQLT